MVEVVAVVEVVEVMVVMVVGIGIAVAVKLLPNFVLSEICLFVFIWEGRGGEEKRGMFHCVSPWICY